mgnify:CR=1 FL=1
MGTKATAVTYEIIKTGKFIKHSCRVQQFQQ